WPRDRITAESWQKIRIGMTEEEVAEMLGGPGMSYQEADAQYDRLEKELGRPPFQMQELGMEEPEVRRRFVLDRVKVWTGRRGSIAIELDQNQHVRWKHFQGVRWTNAGILDRLRDWLGW
ncbi:MAG TPA: hypothetical protein VKE98_02065, partial [Gemmataceae bacterium]|nr:hypothetical protein [Gemmataceae bacterium]